MEIKWSDQLSIDHGVLDEEHKVVIEKANQFLNQDKQFIDADQARQYLGELREHLSVHMAHEEEYQKSIGYDDLPKHQKLHEDLLAELDQILLRLAKIQIFDLTDINKQTAHFLMHFLVKHLLNDDMKLKEFSDGCAKTTSTEDDVTYI